uniref:Ulp1 protease-like n=1 Tax=Oryza sativa subsp. japonica TaxID=39947 RepID=Q654L6_ORYSJ|nr:ulp1 protease-like [Oryza sativa Japonica Group]
MSNTETDLEGVPDKERQPGFYMETTRTTRIVSIFVSLVLLEQGDTYGHGFEEEDYPVVDYESDLQTAMSTTVR